jgi:hypothetical protein
MNRFYDTLKVVGALALAGCGACGNYTSQSGSHQERYSLESEGVTRDGERLYAVGCAKSPLGHRDFPFVFEAKMAVRKAKGLLVLGRDGSMVKRRLMSLDNFTVEDPFQDSEITIEEIEDQGFRTCAKASTSTEIGK